MPKFFVTLHKTTHPAIYLAVGDYTDRQVATAVFKALRRNVINAQYDLLTLDEVSDGPSIRHMSRTF